MLRLSELEYARIVTRRGAGSSGVRLGRPTFRLQAGATRAAPRAAPEKPGPQAVLTRAMRARWPEAEPEMGGVVPGRRFRVDIGFRDPGLVIEVDGWAHHGRRREDLARGLRRQNLLVLHGWRVLRFTAGQIYRDLPGVLAVIERALENSRARGAGEPW